MAVSSSSLIITWKLTIKNISFFEALVSYCWAKATSATSYFYLSKASFGQSIQASRSSCHLLRGLPHRRRSPRCHPGLAHLLLHKTDRKTILYHKKKQFHKKVTTKWTIPKFSLSDFNIFAPNAKHYYNIPTIGTIPIHVVQNHMCTPEYVNNFRQFPQ